MSFERPQELLKPVRLRFIYGSFAIAILINLLPLPTSTVRWMPDFIALLILYWVINQPRWVNVGTAFVLGIIADVASTGMFGQHALAYSITSYLVILRQRQLIMFNLGQQTLSVLALMMANQGIMVITRMATGSAFVGWWYFLPPLTGALLWPLLTKLLLLPYRSQT